MEFNTDRYIKDLNWRYATKQFDPNKKLAEKDWLVLEESLRLSPSSYGLQPWKFLVVQNKDLRAKLKDVSWNQTQVVDCSHYVVFTTLKTITKENVDEFIADIAKQRGATVESLQGYRNAIISDVVEGPRSEIAQSWAQRQSYIAMGNLMNAAAQMRIDTCPLEGLDPAAYDKILNLENTEYAAVAAVAVGYRHADDKYQDIKKVRFPKDRVIQFIN